MRIKFVKKAIIILTLIICLVTINIMLPAMINSGKNTKVSGYKPVLLPFIVLHIDLKGIPPKLEYLESLLPGLKEYGVNGLLMEYEDMFPFDEKLGINANNSYSSTKLKNFLMKAAHLGFEIIPLIQTFGHMEYVLKLQQYKHLREHPLYFDSICPNHPQSIVLIKNMLKQVIYFHSNITTLKYIHIGCDEVYHINKCELCLKKKLADLDIFVNHLQSVIGIVKQISPSTKVLVWDDMFRGSRSDLTKTLLHDTEPVYWDYKPELAVSHRDLIRYHRKFQNIWIASAFKGADGRSSILPNLTNRFLNHHSWMSLISNYKFGGERTVFNFQGIILTGWSRYSHMDVPCDPLPASIHSLMLSLLVIGQYRGKPNSLEPVLSSDQFYKQYIDEKFDKLLQCNNYVIRNDLWCTTKSERLVDLLKTFKERKEDIDKVFADDDNGLSAIKFLTRRFYINKINANYILEWCKNQFNMLTDIEYKLRDIMSSFYDSDVIHEYISYLIYPIKNKLNMSARILYDYIYSTLTIEKQGHVEIF